MIFRIGGKATEDQAGSLAHRRVIALHHAGTHVTKGGALQASQHGEKTAAVIGRTRMFGVEVSLHVFVSLSDMKCLDESHARMGSRLIVDNIDASTQHRTGESKGWDYRLRNCGTPELLHPRWCKVIEFPHHHAPRLPRQHEGHETALREIWPLAAVNRLQQFTRLEFSRCCSLFLRFL